MAKEYDSDASKVDITKKMLLDCRNASQARKDAIAAKKKEKEKDMEDRSAKAKIDAEIKEIEDKKRKATEEADRELEVKYAQLKAMKKGH